MKILIIRFSSFGDIIHCRGTLGPLKKELPNAIVHWLVREDLQGALKGEQSLSKIIAFQRKEGLFGLISLAWHLRSENYDLVYDAHNNLRSFFFRWSLTFLSSSRLLIRPKNRFKRFMLFKLRINKFPWPFKAIESYWKPLKDYLNSNEKPFPINWPVAPSDADKLLLKGRVVLVPATAWPMKSWPVNHWKELINKLPNHQFLILGGPQDKFCDEIAGVAPKRVINLAGERSLLESCSLAAHSDFIITADTGLQQVADLSGRKGLSLIGPSAFGFTTMGTLKTLSTDLECRPCTKDGRGHCSQDVYQKCMVEISPEQVAAEVEKAILV